MYEDLYKGYVELHFVAFRARRLGGRRAMGTRRTAVRLHEPWSELLSRGLNKHTYRQTHTYIYIYICVYICEYVYACMPVNAYVYSYSYVFTYVYTYMRGRGRGRERERKRERERMYWDRATRIYVRSLDPSSHGPRERWKAECWGGRRSVTAPAPPNPRTV